MCLSGEWFNERDARNRQRDVEGVSHEAAERTLYNYHSTVWPVATEMAEWLYKNWTLQQVFELRGPTRELLFHILEKEGIARRQSVDASP